MDDFPENGEGARMRYFAPPPTTARNNAFAKAEITYCQSHPPFYKGWPSVLTKRRQSAEERTTSNGKSSKALRKSRFNVRTR